MFGPALEGASPQLAAIWSTENGNTAEQFLAAWERAPALPISQWFEPELKLPPPDELDDMRKDGVTTVTCEFCNTRYVFDEADLDRLMPG